VDHDDDAVECDRHLDERHGLCAALPELRSVDRAGRLGDVELSRTKLRKRIARRRRRHIDANAGMSLLKSTGEELRDRENRTRTADGDAPPKRLIGWSRSRRGIVVRAMTPVAHERDHERGCEERATPDERLPIVSPQKMLENSQNRPPASRMAAGMVSTHASARLRTVDICSPDPLLAIVPATPDDSTCVVDTGNP
jgi:hypothetical protein